MNYQHDSDIMLIHCHMVLKMHKMMIAVYYIHARKVLHYKSPILAFMLHYPFNFSETQNFLRAKWSQYYLFSTTKQRRMLNEHILKLLRKKVLLKNQS